MTVLANQDWLADARLAKLFAVLEGADGEARVAGGAVRNGLWGLPVADIDVATTLLPEMVMAGARKAGFAVHPTGLEHGTVTVVVDDLAVEVTTLRADVETDGRRAVVAFTTDWATDAARRDFTFNALYCDLAGKVYDETGQGLADSAARRVRFVGSPEQRICEDYLRILRYFRFEAQYGKGELDVDALQACGKLKDGLHGLSVERVQVELLKTLAALRVMAVVKTMAEAGILQELITVESGLDRLEKVVVIENLLQQNPDPVRRLAVLTSDVSHWRLSKAQQGCFARLQQQVEISPDSPVLAKQKLLYELGADGYRDAVVLAWVATHSPADNNDWVALFNFALKWSAPVFPVTGKDLMEAGFRQGKAMGQALASLEKIWIASGFTLRKNDLLKELSSGKKV